MKNELDQAIRTGGGIEHRPVMRGSTRANTRAGQGRVVFANIAPEVVIKEVAEEAENPGFTNTVSGKHARNFSLHVVRCSHPAFDDGFAESLVWFDITKSMIYSQPELPIPQHGPAILVGFSGLGGFDSE